MHLKNICQKLDEINTNDVVKITEEDFKGEVMNKISKMPESLPAYQVLRIVKRNKSLPF